MHRQPVGGHIDHRPVSPEATIHQPIAPCSPPSSAQQQQPPVPARRNAPRAPEAEEAQRPDQADHPAQLAVAPFPPEDRLEGLERHARCSATGIPGSADRRRTRPPSRPRPIGGSAPVSGRHSVIDRPESVSRVSPPTAIIAATSAKQHRSARPGSRRARRRAAGVDHAACGRRRLWRAADLFEYAALAGHGVPPFAAGH